MTDTYSGTAGRDDSEGYATRAELQRESHSTGCLIVVLCALAIATVLTMAHRAADVEHRLCLVERRQQVGTGACP